MAARGGRRQVRLGSDPIGHVDPATDPERFYDQVGALDGGIDALAGHGTFIAGLIHQACPDADIVSWRVVGSEGPIVESDMVKALKDIAQVARRHRDGEAGGHPIDVLNLSLGYYHETPEDELFDPTMYGILRELGECGVVVVLLGRQRRDGASDVPGGLGAVERPAQTIVQAEQTVVPIVSVGALNPNGTDALFSNAGPWVRAHAQGASVMSTLPPFQGGLQPVARLELDEPHPRVDRPRRLQRAVRAVERYVVRCTALRRPRRRTARGHHRPHHDGRGDAVSRGWMAVAALTSITP